MNDNDTRTARERAEEASAKWRPWKDAEVEHRAFLHGYLARDAEVMPVDKLYVKRDAEPTTVTAEQIEDAAREFLRYTETASPDERSSATSWNRARRIARMILLAAGFRIEGDEA